MMKVPKEALIPIAQLYNRDGRTATYDYLRSTYAIKQPYFLIVRLKDKFVYNETEDRFDVCETANNNPDDLFLSLDELCPYKPANAKKVENQKHAALTDRTEATEKLIKELLSDRLLEISRYITIDSLSRTIRIDKTSLNADGYRVIEH